MTDLWTPRKNIGFRQKKTYVYADRSTLRDKKPTTIKKQAKRNSTSPNCEIFRVCLSSLPHGSTELISQNGRCLSVLLIYHLADIIKAHLHSLEETAACFNLYALTQHKITCLFVCRISADHPEVVDVGRRATSASITSISGTSWRCHIRRTFDVDQPENKSRKKFADSCCFKNDTHYFDGAHVRQNWLTELDSGMILFTSRDDYTTTNHFLFVMRCQSTLDTVKARRIHYANIYVLK
jgi:hypothetical protein